MQNDGFRQFLKDRPAGGGGGGADSAESAEARKQRAEEAQRKKERAKAKQERRNMILKKQEAQLAEQSKYRDRAGERRKELDRAIKGDAAPEEVPEAGMGAEAYLKANEDAEAQAAALPSGPTFAQMGGREDLEQQQHRVSIAQSKYLGGDIEHTHLVKGLDFALLQKTRSELSAAELEKQTAAQAAAAAVAARQQPPGAKKALRRRPAGRPAEPDAKSR